MNNAHYKPHFVLKALHSGRRGENVGLAAIDLHCDTADDLAAGKNLLVHCETAHVDLPRLKEGGVACQVFAAYVPASTPPGEAFSYASRRLDLIANFARSDPVMVSVETAKDIRAAIKAGRIGILSAVENGLAIENFLEKLEALRRRGVRIMTLVHSDNLPWVSSCTGGLAGYGPPGAARAAADYGLSGFGKEVIAAMNDLGVIPDLSHASEAAFWDALKCSKKPLIASHSCAYALCAAARNLKDDQLRALGESGGLVGINFFSAFLSEAFRIQWEKSGYSEKSIEVNVPFSIIIDHIDHAVSLAGEDAVSFGSDFDGVSALPEGVSGCDIFPRIEEELRARGYSGKRLKKIFNGNFLRVLEAWDR